MKGSREENRMDREGINSSVLLLVGFMLCFMSPNYLIPDLIFFFFWLYWMMHEFFTYSLVRHHDDFWDQGTFILNNVCYDVDNVIMPIT